MDRRRFVAAGMGTLAAGLASARGVFAAESGRLAQLAGADWPALRGSYQLGPDVLYLNHASIGTIPRPLQTLRQRYLELCESNPWLYMWGGAWEQGREQTRAAAANLLGCEASEVALTHNTTEGMNLLAQGLPLGAGDEVVFSSLNHAGASVCWSHHAATRGFSVRRFDFPVQRAANLTPDDLLEAYDAAISARTRVLVFPHIDNIVGFRYPVRRLAALARQRGVEFVAVDGAQSIGMIPVQLDSLGVDFYATSPHKWLQAPKGVGLLYIAAAVQKQLRPMWVTWGQERWAGTVRIFEDYGTRNLAEVLTLGDAIAFQQELGADAKHQRLHDLWHHAQERVDDSARLRWRSPRNWEFGTASFAVEALGLDSREVSRRLGAEHGAIFRPFALAGLNMMRLSPNVANTTAELDRFFDLVEAL